MWKRERRSVWMVAMACTMAAVCLWPAAAAQAQLTDAQVQSGIDELVERIYAERNDQGIWDLPQEGSGHVEGTNWGGTTALMTFALLTAGESHQNPRLRPAIEFLKNAEMTGTYAISLRAHVWAALPDEFSTYLRRDTQWLLGALGNNGYDYTRTPRSGRVDNSVTQYGVLGVWEGAKRGVPVAERYWEAVQEHFVKLQHDNGGWSYDAAGRIRGSMVAAGLAGLYITQDYLHRPDFRELGVTPEHLVQKRIDRGLEWFARNFAPNTNPGIGASYVHYYLYGVERIGLASGIKYFAGQDWYRSGAEYILSNPGSETDMAFSLMFLVRGRVPVLINKLQISDYHWNNRPRDVANLTRWVSDETERQLIWQVIPTTTEPEEWLEAPILYLSGHEALDLTLAEEAKIKRFIDLGGLLITTADDGRSEFSTSVEQLLDRLYPDYPLAPLSTDDELLDMVFRLGDAADDLSPRSVHNGVRHLAIHLPVDVSWTLHSGDRSDPAIWQFFTNAYFYATERGRMRPRLEQHFTGRQEDAVGGRPVAHVGRAVYDGNHDPEPLAWEVVGNFMYNDARAALETTETPLDALPDPAEVPVVHVAGTEERTFSEAEQSSIQQYVEGGGLIVFENVGGRGEFANAANEMLSELFGRRLRPISLQSSLIRGEQVDGYDVSNVTYRPYTVLRMGDVDAPRLLALTVDDEVRVVVSAEDLSNAALDQPVWGVFGYTADSARRILANIAQHGVR